MVRVWWWFTETETRANGEPQTTLHVTPIINDERHTIYTNYQELLQSQNTQNLITEVKLSVVR